MQTSWSVISRIMGINIWQLRYPVLLTNTEPVYFLLVKLRLLIISDVVVCIDDLFIKDVFRAMSIHCSEVYILTVDRLNRLFLPKTFLSYCWWMGVEALCDFRCITFCTTSLEILKNDADSKRVLWDQICRFMYASKYYA
ncbi:DNA polymerase III, psi subunit [Candidatus Blochmanniella vafra str. BVAF]|uniref:DNA polymerase III subunit psi n=2 Tax=Candidatus Blochmanniella vafra TaxID=251535 RepID=E8Q5M1_BLOVB|nr:DNA polymerase III, psi subunit [Candidatus Blochmannia vafer str. BVAF]